MRITSYDRAKDKEIFAGELTPSGDFIKNVVRARHYLRVVSGYAISEDAVEKITGLCNRIIFHEKDTNKTLEIPFQDFLSHSRKWTHGHGPQKSISEKYLKEIK